MLNIPPILRDETHLQHKQHTSLKYAFTAVPNHEHYELIILGKRETFSILNYKYAAPANHQQPTSKPQIIPESNEGTIQENDQKTNVCFPDLEIGDDELTAIDINPVIESISNTNEFPNSENSDHDPTKLTKEDHLVTEASNTKKSRKSLSQPELCKGNIRMNNRSMGLAYTSRSEKVISAKALRDIGTCQLHCSEKFQQERASRDICEYWSTRSTDRQRDFICPMVEENVPVTQR